LENSKINVPNILTIIRLVCSPLFLPFLIVYLLPLNLFWLNSVVALLFGFFSLTDFFDGYLARKFKQETRLGQVLDPIADKFLLYASLVALLTINKIYFYWVIILIGREIFMMGLRNIALEHHFTIKVSMLGKIKTFLQMITIFILILNPYQDLGFTGAPKWNATEQLFLFATILIALLSAYKYYQSFVALFYKEEESMPSLDEQEEDGEFGF